MFRAQLPQPLDRNKSWRTIRAVKKPEDPPMIGLAERMWVKIEMKPKVVAEATRNPETTPTKTATTTPTKTGSTTDELDDKTCEIREAWLWGSVALHQDPAEGKTKGQDASGEALYLDNRGPNKAISFVYQREPKATIYLPGPLPPARIENDEKTITGAGIIAMNQATDQIWVEGPGMLTQLSERGAGSVDLGLKPAGTTASRATVPTRDAQPRTTSLLAQTGNETVSADQKPDSKPKTRAGRPLGEKIQSTIQFSEGMEFNGRTVDPEGHATGRADFYGTVTAQLEDALLHCEERMIAYTDKVVPLAQIGAMSKTPSKSKSTDFEMAGAPATGNGDDEPGPQLTLIKCYRNAIGVSRKVDPIAPIVLQKQRIEADDLLDYDRRKGDFYVPGKGRVFLYDRSDNSRADGMNLDGEGDNSPEPTVTARTVTYSSSRTVATPFTRTRSTARPQQAGPPTDSKANELPPWF